MPNALVEMLKQCGIIGKGRAVSREWAARYMKTPIREVQSLSEESRNAGIPTEIVCYTSAGKKKGLYLAAGSDEILEMKLKITREAKARLIQRKGLQRALMAVQPNTVFPTPPDKLKQADMFSAEAPR